MSTRSPAPPPPPPPPVIREESAEEEEEAEEPAALAPEEVRKNCALWTSLGLSIEMFHKVC